MGAEQRSFTAPVQRWTAAGLKQYIREDVLILPVAINASNPCGTIAMQQCLY
jgi:hypothetical protein